MRYVLIVVIFLFSPMASQAANTYSDGYDDGYSVGKTDGLSLCSPPIAVTTFDIRSSIQSIRLGGQIGASTNMEIPTYYLVPTQSLGSGGEKITSGAIPFYGILDLSDQSNWASILSTAAAESGASAKDMSLYAVPVDQLTTGKSDVQGFVFDGALPNAQPRRQSFGDAEAALGTFGDVLLNQGANLNVINGLE